MRRCAAILINGAQRSALELVSCTTNITNRNTSNVTVMLESFGARRQAAGSDIGRFFSEEFILSYVAFVERIYFEVARMYRSGQLHWS